MNTPLKPHPAPDPVYERAVFTSEEFETLVAKGAFAGLGRFELREGIIYRMNAQHAPHARAKMELAMALRAAFTAAPDYEVVIEGSVRFEGGFSPEPDILVWRVGEAPKAFPGDRVCLIVEVSDSTLADDLGAKRDLYARAGLPEYWVADLNARVIHQFADPVEGAYRKAAQAVFGAKVASLSKPALVSDTAGLARL